MEYCDADALLGVPQHKHSAFYKDTYAILGKYLRPGGRKARIGRYMAHIAEHERIVMW
jgi:hypothetical protein